MPVTHSSLFSKLFRRTTGTVRCTPPATRACLGLTALEAREVPAAAALAGGVLTVTGTPQADTIAGVQAPSTPEYGVIRLAGGTISVGGRPRAEAPDIPGPEGGRQRPGRGRRPVGPPASPRRAGG